MDCERTAEIEQELDSVRAKLQNDPSPESRAEEEALTKRLWDHKISHNSGLVENCKKK
jgi:hypothetical protein